MCSYGAVNGTPDCADGALINGVIRKEWNWTGFVVSDCDAVQGIEGHMPGIAHEAAAALAITGGVDLNCGPQYNNFLAPAVSSGLVSRDKVEEAATRVLEHQIALGTFDQTTPYDHLNYSTTARTLFLRPYLAHFCPFFLVFSRFSPS